MTSWPSPVDDMGPAGWSAGAGIGDGGGRPWWDFPTPLGPPKQQSVPGICIQEWMAPNGEEFGAPVMCGPVYMPGQAIPGSGAQWQSWFSE